MTENESDGACIHILLVEDNPGDVRLTQKAFEKAKLHNQLHVVTDGIEALTYLRKEEPYAQAVHPDLILLDLNLPKKNGHEVLAEIKGDPELRRIPVVVLTSSTDETDVRNSYDEHASGFVTKPVSLDGLMGVVQAIEGFWLQIVRLPPR